MWTADLEDVSDWKNNKFCYIGGFVLHVITHLQDLKTVLQLRTWRNGIA
jgi:hypothetical protein